MAHKKSLSRVDIGISVNTAVEVAPKFAKGMNRPVLPLIMEIAEWLQEQYLANHENKSTAEINYAVAATIRTLADMVLYDTIHKLEVDKWVKVPSKEVELEFIFKVGVTIIRSILSKIK